MSIIKSGNSAVNIKSIKSSEYEIPAVIRDEDDEISLKKALLWALVLHPVFIILLLAASVLLQLLGVNLNLFHKPELVSQDIEFVIVEKEAPPIDKNTKNRVDKDSQAGGKHDPSRPVSMPQEPAPKAEAPKPAKKEPPKKQAQKPQPKQPPKQVQKPQPKPQPKTQAQPQPQKPAVQPKPEVQPPAPQPVQEQPKPQPPKPQAPKPAVSPSKPIPKPNTNSAFNIPVQPKGIQTAEPVSAPVTSAPSTGTGSPYGGGSSSPSPDFSPSTGGRNTSGSGSPYGGRFSDGRGYNRTGNPGNPGPGNPNGAPGIDAVKEPDFGPYMKELQRRIKMNWDPPKGNESKRVVLLFSIARDGRLLNVKVHKSSGLNSADNAAVNAVKLTAPFKPLPPDFKGDKVDIQFTFDYTVFGISGY